MSGGLQRGATVAWAFEKVDVTSKAIDAVIDLRFENTAENRQWLQQAKGLKIINSVVHTLPETDASTIRINGWSTFLNAHGLEASSRHEDLKKLAETVFSFFNKEMKWLPDEPGFVTPRVVSLIVNEAYLALFENVSRRADMDLAMKLGTAYPYGPFAWSEKIGLKNIALLLQKLSAVQSRYTPAALLLQEAGI